MHMLQSLFYQTIALRVSGIIITHLQEHKTTLTTAYGNSYYFIRRLLYTFRVSLSPIFKSTKHL